MVYVLGRPHSEQANHAADFGPYGPAARPWPGRGKAYCRDATQLHAIAEHGARETFGQYEHRHGRPARGALNIKLFGVTGLAMNLFRNFSTNGARAGREWHGILQRVAAAGYWQSTNRLVDLASDVAGIRGARIPRKLAR